MGRMGKAVLTSGGLVSSSGMSQWISLRACSESRQPQGVPFRVLPAHVTAEALRDDIPRVS
jgi:hypothetical protein